MRCGFVQRLKLARANKYANMLIYQWLILRYEVWVRAKTEAGQGPPTRTVTARLEQRGDQDYDCDDDEDNVIVIGDVIDGDKSYND